MIRARVRVDAGGLDRVAALEAGQQAAASMNTLGVNPRQVSQAFVAAHDKLVVAVANGEDQDEAVLQSLTEFVTRADALRRATQKLP